MDRMIEKGLFPVKPTPVQYLGKLPKGQEIFMKRDDLLGFSFGGNKARIGAAFLQDMEKKGKDFMVSYGSCGSNLNRTMALLCKSRNIPCLIIVSGQEAGGQTFNRQIAADTGARQVLCGKDGVAATVEQVMEELEGQGYKPYYLYGDARGMGNEEAARSAYMGAYEEIRRWQQESGVRLTHIFHASGTGMTQGGLVAGKELAGGQEEIIGISVARDAERGISAVRRYAGEGAGAIRFETDYRCGGYGLYDRDIQEVIREMMNCHGIALDPTYTGKGYSGMVKWLARYGDGSERVLFIHTGGLPLYFDYLRGL